MVRIYFVSKLNFIHKYGTWNLYTVVKKKAGFTILKLCCTTKINIKCYELETLAKHIIYSDFNLINGDILALYL